MKKSTILTIVFVVLFEVLWILCGTQLTFLGYDIPLLTHVAAGLVIGFVSSLLAQLLVGGEDA